MIKRILWFTKTRILVFLHILLALSTAMIVYAYIVVNSIMYDQGLNYKNHIRYHIANDSFRQGTDLLTEAVRRYVVTMDPKFMEAYFDEARSGRHRDLALEMIKDLQIDTSLKYPLINAMRVSMALMKPEYHAMHLIAPEKDKELLHSEVKGCPLEGKEHDMAPAERRKRAMELLWDDSYNEHKAQIYKYMSDGIIEANRQARTRHRELNKKLLRMLVLGAVNLIVLVLTICGFVFCRHYQRERMIEEQARESERMNAQLKKEHEKLIKAEKARSYFFSSVSHDIRTPLNSIIGFSEMLHLGIDDPKEKEKALDAIITSGQTLLELINDVLDLSKLESGKMELHPVPTDIAALIDKVTDSFEAATSRTSVRIETEVGTIPPLKLDPQRIRQILFNLIGNAVKFTFQGSITVRAAYEDRTLTLAVADTGCGISEENIGKLMSPYVQLQEHDSNLGGTGLGLAICKQLSNQMNGTLEIESTVGKGSTFTLRLPNVEAVSEEETAAYFKEREAKAPGGSMHLDESIAGKRILIVDDQKLNQRILQAMLTRLGIRKMLTAENGKEALETLRLCGNVDIVLTDMSMPVMDGAALVREIRKSPRFEQLPVYVITADVEMQGEYSKLGFDDILIKPMTLEKLRGLLAKYSPHRPPKKPADSGDAAQG